MGKNFAISIGINAYDFLTPLKYAKPDAHLMQEFLRNHVRCEKVLFYSDDSPDFKGKSTRPSFTNLNRVLRTMFEKPFMEVGDNFWFFFSGHGRRHKWSDYLMASDSDPDDVERTAISISYVTEQLRRCGAGNIILILDACRDQGSKSGEGIGNQAAEVARQKGIITFFSCSPNQLSYEIETLQQGIFTKAVLEGLGIQGKCATVERLNHYLSVRVPELIREHKGEQVRQTPYCIAEPVTKSHLIICPQYATLQDVSILKNDGYQAEVNKDYDLAKQLWIRVLAASTGDMDAINGIQRIAIKQIENDRYSQENSVSSNVANKSASPLSPKSTPVTNANPTEADVPLKSERGVDYTKLRDLLATEKWQQADKETANKMLEVAGRTEEGWLRVKDIDRFPCEDLRTIDQLWVKYSNGRFGFSVQKRIFENVGRAREDDEKIWEAFGDRVGWRANGKWLYYKDVKFNKSAPSGHLPLGGGWWVGEREGLGMRGSGGEGEEVRERIGEGLRLFSRVETCKL